jgi:glycosyltransferase involved in cell wall biosynthesis
VVAAAVGGALETVIDGITGVLVPPGDVKALAAVLGDGQVSRFDPVAAVANAQRFSVDTFKDGILTQVTAALA